MFKSDERFVKRREEMVLHQIERRGLQDGAVLQAMRIVPREVFVQENFQDFAYEDSPLPIPGSQTISQPYVVALMISALQLKSSDKVLEIGTGSGYAAALLAEIAAEVHTVERLNKLVQYARDRLKLIGYDNVFVHHGDGTLGWPENAPYDGIVVAAGGPSVPPALKEQLVIGGKLVIPIGSSERRQNLVCIVRESETAFLERELGAVAFVPLIGEEGW